MVMQHNKKKQNSTGNKNKYESFYTRAAPISCVVPYVFAVTFYVRELHWIAKQYHVTVDSSDFLDEFFILSQ